MNLRKLWALVALLCLTACAQPVPNETVDELDRLTSAAVGLIGTPEAVQTVALTEAFENEKRCSYLSGQSYALGAPTPAPRVSALAREQGEAGRALEAYMKALVDATRGNSVANLERATSDFGTSFSALATATGDTALTDPLAASIDFVGRTGETARQNRIRAIMFGATDTLLNFEALLRRDATQVISESTAAVTRWDRAARCVLRQTRTRGGAIEVFDSYDDTREALGQQLSAIERAPDTLDLLTQAHLEATDTDLSFEEGLRGFVDILKSDDTLKRALGL